jgi:hypothetical protein
VCILFYVVSYSQIVQLVREDLVMRCTVIYDGYHLSQIGSAECLIFMIYLSRFVSDIGLLQRNVHSDSEIMI